MLTDSQIKNTKSQKQLVKLTDGGGLYLEVTPSGGKHWRFRFRLAGKEGLYAIGSYPDIKAAEARRLKEDVRGSVHIV